MANKNKFYWFEGVTKREVYSLLTKEDSKYRWLRSQRNRRKIVILLSSGFALLAMGSYWPTIKANLELTRTTEIVIVAFTVTFVIASTLLGCHFLRISVRGITIAPDELLDERQLMLRNTSFRYAYYLMSYLVFGLLILMIFAPKIQMFQPNGNDGSYILISALFFASFLPSMVLAWRERDI